MSINHDKKIYPSIYKSIVSKGLRPESQEYLDALLDTIGGKPLTEDKFCRMLRKVKGEEPFGFETCSESPNAFASLTSQEEQLLAFYREQGKQIPPEILRKLEEMRKRAKEEQDKEDANGEK
jgi:hypothetical protein